MLSIFRKKTPNEPAQKAARNQAPAKAGGGDDDGLLKVMDRYIQGDPVGAERAAFEASVTVIREMKKSLFVQRRITMISLVSWPLFLLLGGVKLLTMEPSKTVLIQNPATGMIVSAELQNDLLRDQGAREGWVRNALVDTFTYMPNVKDTPGGELTDRHFARVGARYFSEEAFAELQKELISSGIYARVQESYLNSILSETADPKMTSAKLVGKTQTFEFRMPARITYKSSSTTGSDLVEIDVMVAELDRREALSRQAPFKIVRFQMRTVRSGTGKGLEAEMNQAARVAVDPLGDMQKAVSGSRNDSGAVVPGAQEGAPR